jgi:hypothetical protein
MHKLKLVWMPNSIQNKTSMTTKYCMQNQYVQSKALLKMSSEIFVQEMEVREDNRTNMQTNMWKESWTRSYNSQKVEF